MGTQGSSAADAGDANVATDRTDSAATAMAAPTRRRLRERVAECGRDMDGLPRGFGAWPALTVIARGRIPMGRLVLLLISNT